ncbi:uncharacterized protein [Ptychodera flava]|uniref:uncharacterized protein n=1 Tax=Ptychodera flava TaxID=63121 RepID=UPI003969CBC6
MSNGNKMVSTLVQVHHSGTWNIEIYGKPAKASPIFHEIPKCLDTSSCHTLFNLIETSTHCIGNNGYDKLCRSKSPNNLTMFFNKHNEIEAYEQDLVTYRTVRHMKCEILITQNSSSRCSVCSIYRSYLSTQNSINNKNVLTDATNQKYTRNDLLSRQVLEGKTRKLQKENEQLKRKVQNLQDRVRHVIEEKGETLDEDLSTSFSSVMNDKNNEVMSCFPADSAQRIFWQQQKQAVEVKSKTQRRWHPMMIKWCIALHAKSSSAYRFLRSTNMLILPGESTLRDYTKFSTTTDGVNYDIIRRIKEEMKEEPEFKRNVSLLFDEVK